MVDGMGVLLKKREDKKAIFGLPPHEVIAQNPLCAVHTMKSGDVKRIGRAPQTSCDSRAHSDAHSAGLGQRSMTGNSSKSWQRATVSRGPKVATF